MEKRYLVAFRPFAGAETIDDETSGEIDLELLFNAIIEKTTAIQQEFKKATV